MSCIDRCCFATTELRYGAMYNRSEETPVTPDTAANTDTSSESMKTKPSVLRRIASKLSRNSSSNSSMKAAKTSPREDKGAALAKEVARPKPEFQFHSGAPWVR